MLSIDVSHNQFNNVAGKEIRAIWQSGQFEKQGNKTTSNT